jgi:selenide,water dikinase
VDSDVGPLEDAALLRPEIGFELAFTVDFITPIVDGPEDFGAIAAANAISDVYAMGGEPQVALAVCGFPDEKLPLEVVTRIFRGGRDKAAEAGCAIVGGHTVLDPELKYGLCVIGRVPEDRRLTHTAARPGDRLVLTKPVGTGLAAQAIKEQRLGPGELALAVATMTTLNRDAKNAALAAGCRAATDVTGFGLLGHLHHLLLGSGLAARLEASAVPLLPFARRLAEQGLVPGGTRRNADYVTPHVDWDAGLGEAERLLLCDAQTSGGLLLAVPPGSEEALLADLERRGTPAAASLGEVVEGESGRIRVEG